MANPDHILEFFTSYLGVNPSMGCPNGCGYCVLDKDIPNPGKRKQKETAKYTLDLLLTDERVTRTNPLAFFNLSDPFLRENVPDLLTMLEGLEAHNYENIAVIITKLNPRRTAPDEHALRRISQLKKVKPVIIVSYASAIRPLE